MIGERFGRLVVTGEIRVRDTRRVRLKYACRCDCGATTGPIEPANLRSGNTSSCGCLQRERTRAACLRHGHGSKICRSPTYRSWQSMRDRCVNREHKDYRYYGGRGITVCQRWQTFENFLSDMGERPVGRTLDRKENDVGYEPGNCRWATGSEQRLNQRRNHHTGE